MNPLNNTKVTPSLDEINISLQSDVKNLDKTWELTKFCGNFKTVPYEIIRVIFSFLSEKDFSALRTCKLFYWHGVKHYSELPKQESFLAQKIFIKMYQADSLAFLKYFKADHPIFQSTINRTRQLEVFSAAGLTDRVKQLSKEPFSLIGFKKACKNGHADVVRELLNLKKGQALTKENFLVGMEEACKNGHVAILQVLIAELVKKGEIEPLEIQSLFKHALNSEQKLILDYLIQNYSQLLFTRQLQITHDTLIKLCNNNQSDIIKFIAPFIKFEGNTFKVIIFSLNSANLDVKKVLVDEFFHRLSTKGKENFCENLLSYHQKEMVKYILTINPANHRFFNQTNVFFALCEFGDLELFKKFYPNKNISIENLKIGLDRVIYFKHEQLFDFLIQDDSLKDELKKDFKIDNLSHLNLNFIKKIIDRLNLTIDNSAKEKIFLSGCCSGDLDKVKWALNSSNIDLSKGLNYAASNHHIEVLEYLLPLDPQQNLEFLEKLLIAHFYILVNVNIKAYFQTLEGFNPVIFEKASAFSKVISDQNWEEMKLFIAKNENQLSQIERHSLIEITIKEKSVENLHYLVQNVNLADIHISNENLAVLDSLDLEMIKLFLSSQIKFDRNQFFLNMCSCVRIDVIEHFLELEYFAIFGSPTEKNAFLKSIFLIQNKPFKRAPLFEYLLKNKYFLASFPHKINFPWTSIGECAKNEYNLELINLILQDCFTHCYPSDFGTLLQLVGENDLSKASNNDLVVKLKPELQVGLILAAIRSGSLETIEELVNLQTDQFVKDNIDYFIKCSARVELDGKSSILSLFLNKCPFDHKLYYSALIEAATSDCLENFKLVINHPSFNPGSYIGLPSMMIEEGREEILKVLIADSRLPKNIGKLIICAYENNQPQMVKLLIGKTPPFAYAIKTGNFTLGLYLIFRVFKSTLSKIWSAMPSTNLLKRKIIYVKY